MNADQDKIDQLYGLYLAVRKSYFSVSKQRNVIRSLLVGEEWSWRVQGISENAILVYAANDYKIVKRMLERHHIVPFSETARVMLEEKALPKAEWWELIYSGEKTYLVTKDEHKSGKYSRILKVDPGLGMFANQAIGWKYRKKEAEFLKKLANANGIGASGT